MSRALVVNAKKLGPSDNIPKLQRTSASFPSILRRCSVTTTRRKPLTIRRKGQRREGPIFVSRCRSIFPVSTSKTLAVDTAVKSQHLTIRREGNCLDPKPLDVGFEGPKLTERLHVPEPDRSVVIASRQGYFHLAKRLVIPPAASRL